MKYQTTFKYALSSALVCFAFMSYAQTCVAQATTGFTVTASDDAVFLGQALFPDSQGDPFRFDSAVLDFGLAGVTFEDDPAAGFGLGPEDGDGSLAASRDSIGTFVNSSSVYGIGDPGNTVAAGIAISSGLVENYSVGPNFLVRRPGLLEPLTLMLIQEIFLELPDLLQAKHKRIYCLDFLHQPLVFFKTQPR